MNAEGAEEEGERNAEGGIWVNFLRLLGCLQMYKSPPKHVDSNGFEVPEWLNALSFRVLGACIEVHRTFGPGLLERIYEQAVCHELSLAKIPFANQVPVTLAYKGLLIDGLRLDLVVDSVIVLELKAVESVPEVHLAQLMSYCRACDAPLGLLVNFNVDVLKSGMYRRLNRPSIQRHLERRAAASLEIETSTHSPQKIPSG